MSIGLSTAAFYGIMETEDAAGRVAALGIPCCEVFLETYSEYTPAFGEIIRARLGHTRAASVHAKGQHFEGDLWGQSQRQRQDAFAMLRGFLQAGQAFGAGVYVYHGPASTNRGTPDFARWQQGIARAIALAAEHGIQLAWETVSWCHLNEPSRIKTFDALWPDLRYVLDVKQVFQLGQSPLDYVDAMGGRLCHVHMLDYTADGRLTLPGRGMHDFGDLARALRANGYAGDIILEPYADIYGDEQELLASIDWLKETFGA